MELKEFIKSKIYLVIVVALLAIVILVLTFGAGMYIGFRKARFSYQWGENYHKNFAGPRGGFFRDFGGRDLIDAHGVSGQVIKIDSSTLIVKGRDNVEKIVLIKDDTVINRLGEAVKLSDLKINDLIVVIGSPNNQGQIESKFIRILPSAMPLPMSGTSLPIFRNK